MCKTEHWLRYDHVGFSTKNNNSLLRHCKVQGSEQVQMFMGTDVQKEGRRIPKKPSLKNPALKNSVSSMPEKSGKIEKMLHDFYETKHG